MDAWAKRQRGACNLNSDTIVIADELNYIKGFRYQMYRLAREVSARVATVGVSNLSFEHCDLMQDSRYSLRHRHQQRAEDERYTDSTWVFGSLNAFDPVNVDGSSRFDNLIRRYEEPWKLNA